MKLNKMKKIKGVTKIKRHASELINTLQKQQDDINNAQEVEP
jgi:hypothetical protein